MKFKGIVKESNPYAKVVALAVAAYMLFVGFTQGEYVYIPVALIIFSGCVLKKEQIVAEDGVEITYALFGIVTHNRWTWDEITAIHMDSQRARPNVRMHFAKDGNGRMLLLSPEDCEGILQLVKQVRPDLEVTDIADKRR